MNDEAILGRLLHEVSGKCRHCECSGDSCSIGGGEKCGFVDSLRTLCNAPACQQKEFYLKQDLEREEKRKADAAERAAKVPYWMRNRAKQSGQKRKRRNASRRAA